MSTAGPFRVRTMRPDEVPFAIDLAAAEGWDPGLDDAACFVAVDVDGFLVGEIGSEPVGCIAAVAYGSAYGFIGLYIVRPEYRGRGFGLELWNAAMSRLRGRNVGLDGVVAEQANYARSGFRLAYRNIRYRGVARASSVSGAVAPAAAFDFDTIAAFDRHVFPERRDAFLRRWLAQPRAGAYVAYDAGRAVGYVVVRPSRAGWKIGPLAANAPDVARRLYDAAAGHADDGAAIFVDVPEVNADARAMVAALSLTPVFETARMYTGPDPAVDLAKLYGVTTFELG